MGVISSSLVGGFICRRCDLEARFVLFENFFPVDVEVPDEM